MKWIFAVLGYLLKGPIGAIIGFILGAILEDSSTFKVYRNAGQASRRPAGTTYVPNDFSSSLLILCAAVMKADQKVMRSELDYVRNFFVRQFGELHTNERMLVFREILKQDVAIGQVCEQIRHSVDAPSRL